MVRAWVRPLGEGAAEGAGARGAALSRKVGLADPEGQARRMLECDKFDDPHERELRPADAPTTRHLQPPPGSWSSVSQGASLPPRLRSAVPICPSTVLVEMPRVAAISAYLSPCVRLGSNTSRQRSGRAATPSEQHPRSPVRRSGSRHAARTRGSKGGGSWHRSPDHGSAHDTSHPVRSACVRADQACRHGPAGPPTPTYGGEGESPGFRTSGRSPTGGGSGNPV